MNIALASMMWSARARPSASEAGPATKRIVVAYGFWIFLLSDIVMFAALFAAYAVLRTRPREGRVARSCSIKRSVAVETAAFSPRATPAD